LDFPFFYCAMRITTLASIVFARHQEAGAVSHEEVASLRLLGPRFRRAIEISNLPDIKTIEVATFTSTFEVIAAGIVLVYVEARLIHANAAARSILRQQIPYELITAGLTCPRLKRRMRSPMP
jgi:hypothetical protein